MTLFQIALGAIDDIIAQKVTSSSATDVVDATDEPWYVQWFQVNENAGATPSLTVEIYDGTNSYYLGAEGSVWRAKALTANQSVTFSEGYLIPQGYKLRVTSSDAAGKIEVSGIKTRRIG